VAAGAGRKRERTWALVSARAEGISIRTLAAAGGLSPSRVHQLAAGAGLDALEAALGELRAAGRPPRAVRRDTAGLRARGQHQPGAKYIPPKIQP
jgi:hypothetical protein